MKLNSFGETIARIEAERMAEARTAIDAGWEPSDHPDVCCPPAKSQLKRSVRPIEEIERLRAGALNRAKWWTDAASRAQAELDTREAARPRFDHGMLNTPVGPRARDADATQRIWRDLEYRKDRAKHFGRLAEKYTQQIEKRTK